MFNQYGKGKSQWTLVSNDRIYRDNRVYVLCRCSCGNEKEVIYKNYKSGASKSCGCVGKKKTIKRNTKHTLRFSKEWRAWQAMKNRCYNKNVPGYKNYGGRGIKVFKLWKDNFMQFYTYMGEAPVGTTLDRIDVNGNYEPGNVRWATRKQQSQNKRNNHKINGVCISEISKSLGGGHSLVAKRLNRGWELERAITTKTNASN